MAYPQIAENVFIADSARICGEVTLEADCTVMHHVTIRGDVSAIHIGQRVNIQDGTVVHTKTGVPLDIESDVGIGHRAVVHCRRVRSHSLIGIGAILLDDVEVGSDCLIAAGALVPPGTIIPDGKLVVGVPGRVLRDVTAADLDYIDHVIRRYLDLNKRHAAGEFPTYGTTQ